MLPDRRSQIRLRSAATAIARAISRSASMRDKNPDSMSVCRPGRASETRLVRQDGINGAEERPRGFQRNS